MAFETILGDKMISESFRRVPGLLQRVSGDLHERFREYKGYSGKFRRFLSGAYKIVIQWCFRGSQEDLVVFQGISVHFREVSASFRGFK